jgi:fumarylpyruvate hydrolase
MVHHFWCVGRNYAEHAKELGNSVPSEPLIFSKSAACQNSTQEIFWPSFCGDIHHEIEIVLLLGSDLRISHWTLGLDLTDRSAQNRLKSLGSPWELAKSFQGSAVLGPWQKWTDFDFLKDKEFTLSVNEEIRQRGQMQHMIFKPQDLLEYIGKRFPLVAGDAVFTGTPSGVGPLKSKDRVKAQMAELTLTWTVR